MKEETKYGRIGEKQKEKTGVHDSKEERQRELEHKRQGWDHERWGRRGKLLGGNG
ncbi:MAG: hypothetical protein HFH24_05935 [Ruminococcus sp.]|nr:hypothetical protein [Ruminococcus sp.]